MIAGVRLASDPPIDARVTYLLDEHFVDEQVVDPKAGVARPVLPEEIPEREDRLFRMKVPERIDHLPGQHYVVRLRSDDGYVARLRERFEGEHRRRFGFDLDAPIEIATVRVVGSGSDGAATGARDGTAPEAAPDPDRTEQVFFDGGWRTMANPASRGSKVLALSCWEAAERHHQF